jgi:hypothetical protein
MAARRTPIPSTTAVAPLVGAGSPPEEARPSRAPDGVRRAVGCTHPPDGGNVSEVVVRCTSKALKLLGLRAADLAAVGPGDDDWYLNLLWFDRRKCLLLTHAGTVFSVFVPDVRARDLDPLGPFLVGAIGQALDAEHLPHHALGPLDPQDVSVAKTASRRVLGWMNEIAVHLDYLIPHGRVMDIDVIGVNRQLQRTLHGHDDCYERPLDLVAARAGTRSDAGEGDMY